MKKIFLFLGVLAVGCASAELTDAPAPQERLDTAKAVRFSGEITPYEIGFSGVYDFNGEAVRMVIFSDVGIKLLDAGVWADKALVYYRAPQLPKRVQGAFARLARAHFFTSCPLEEVTHYDKALRGTFQVRTQGGVCP